MATHRSEWRKSFNEVIFALIEQVAHEQFVRVGINHLPVAVLNSRTGLGSIDEGQLLQLGGHGTGAKVATIAMVEMPVAGAGRPAAAVEVVVGVTVVTRKCLEEILE